VFGTDSAASFDRRRGPVVTEPLRIGVLGAARIADEGIVGPARALGHRIVAIAARDRGRAESFADRHGVEWVHDNYRDVIDDPKVDVVYNALVNSLHTSWNVAALCAGKHVLSEKPMSSNGIDARAVRDAARDTGTTIVEGFHYLHHPVSRRLRELVTSGGLGTVEHVEIELTIPAPPGDDPRWSRELDGGATMDLGCYVLGAARHLGHWIGEAPGLDHIKVRRRAPDVDSAVSAELTYAGGATGRVVWDMDAPDRRMLWTVRGSKATAVVPAFAVPHTDPRLMITDASGTTREEHLGTGTSYTHQLAALAETLQRGTTFLVDVEDAVANADLVDSVYHAAGLTTRGDSLS
jgi:predicted dehydrogenase